jgi:hypothetical protein
LSEGLGRTCSLGVTLGPLETAPNTTRLRANPLAMPRILPPEARRRHWHGRYSAGAAADLAVWRGAQRRAPSSTSAAGAPQLPAVACVLACEAFIAAPVVTCEARHQLLGFCTCCVRRLSQEVHSVVPSERCGNTPMMEDLDVSILAASESEAEVRWVGRRFGGHGAQRGVPVRPNVRANATPADCRLGREAHNRQRAPRGQGGRPLGVAC